MAGDLNKLTLDDFNAGINLIEEVYPRFGLIPGPIIVPGKSVETSVVSRMKAKCLNINGCFRTIAVADLSTYNPDPTKETYKGAATYSEVAKAKADQNFVDPNLIVCWPRIALGGKRYHLSTHVAALMMKVDAEHDDLPYKSPSNETLQMDKATGNSAGDIYLSKAQANELNGHGIVTTLRFAGAQRCWGNRTSAYDIAGGTTDPKDAFIPVRRMMTWVANTLVVSFFSRLDEPITKRLVESVMDSAQIWLNGLVARGALVGGKIQFLEEENPATDLSDGIIRFHLSICPPSPAREIDFVIEYQPKYYEGLFE